MKTKYETMEFKPTDRDEDGFRQWSCNEIDGRGKIGEVYWAEIVEEWYFHIADLSESGFSAQQLRDIADFLDQLNEAEK